MIGPLVVFTIVAVLALKPSKLDSLDYSSTPGSSAPVDWFYWHPFLMLVGTVPIATSAVLIKKIGGIQVAHCSNVVSIQVTIIRKPMVFCFS